MVTKALGPWQVGDLLGRGGNADVYRGTSADGVVALKVYRHERSHPHGLQRFRDEVEALQRCKAIGGVMPLITWHLPDTPSAANPAWFAMPVCEPLQTWVGNSPSLEVVVSAVSQIAHSVSRVHEIGISHRDLKPANLYRYGDRYLVADFGLADFADKSALTAEGEKIGPIHYIAPEMLNDATAADGQPADVYSLAKTLWVFATGQRYPLPGEMRRSEPAFRVSTYVTHTRAPLLNSLIDAATQLDPSKRPKMQQFARELDGWIAVPRVTPEDPLSTDLSALADEITAANELYHANQQKQRSERESMYREIKRLIELFRPVVTELGTALKTAGLIDARFDVSQPGGVGAPFYVKGYIVAGTWRGEIELHINGLVIFREPEQASVEVSYSYQVNQNGKTPRIDAWQASATFLPGGASEEAEISRIIAEMRQQFRPFVMRGLSLSRGSEGSPPA